MQQLLQELTRQIENLREELNRQTILFKSLRGDCNAAELEVKKTRALLSSLVSTAKSVVESEEVTEEAKRDCLEAIELVQW